MAIGAVIGIISSVIQAVRAFSPPEPPQKADKLFAELDALGKGELQRADLEQAFSRIADKATAGADKLFSRLDADGDGTLTRSEFSGSINNLAEQLDGHFQRQRLYAAAALPGSEAGFSRESLTGMVSGIAANFDRADADGDGRVSLREARQFSQSARGEGANARIAGSDSAELMLMVARLMQAYGIVQGTSTTAGASNDSDTAAAATRISTLG